MITNIHDSGIVYTIYSRVSTNKEAQIVSKRYQDEDLQRIGDAFKNWKHAKKDYSDDGKTGTNIFYREAFQELLRDAEGAKKFNLIVMRDVSRFARNMKDFENFIDYFHKQGVAIFFTQNNSLSNSSEGRLLLQFMAVLAEAESEQKSAYSRSGQAFRRDLGYVFGANDKYGYDLIKTGKGQSNLLKKNDKEAAIVTEIYERALNGEGIRSIVHDLHKRGIPTKHDKDWENSTVAGILHNKVYCGYVRYNTSYKKSVRDVRKKNRKKEDYVYIKSDYVDVIIDEDTFNKVQEELKSRTKVIPKAVYDENNQPIQDEDGKYIIKPVGYRPITNIYSAKLQCECNCTFKKRRMGHLTKKGTQIIGFSCYNHESGKLINGKPCGVKPFDKVKLDMMALKIFESIWGNWKEAIEKVYNLIIENYQEELDKKELPDITKIDKEIETLKRKQAKNLDKQIELEIAIEDNNNQNDVVMLQRFKELGVEYNSQLESLQNRKKEAEFIISKVKKFDKHEEFEKIKEELSKDLMKEINEFGYEEVSQSVIDEFVSKIIVHADGSFDWYINLSGGQHKPFVKNKFDKDYNKRYEISDTIIELTRFVVDIDEASEFVRSFGRRKFRKEQWQNIVANVYVEY